MKINAGQTCENKKKEIIRRQNKYKTVLYFEYIIEKKNNFGLRRPRKKSTKLSVAMLIYW